MPGIPNPIPQPAPPPAIIPATIPAPGKPDYGIDAPGVRRGMLAAGLGGAALCALSIAIAASATGPAGTAATALAPASLAASLYGLGMAAYMTHGSRIGKLRTRERLLDLADTLSPWTGNETVLDVGCGRGLMLIGAARRLTTGCAIGIDLWRAEDQAGNTPAATLENARREHVANRVHLQTADARNLPFADATFDVVMSHWVIHNLPQPQDRTRALDEMLRVLRPGGTLILADIAHHQTYRAQLKAHGLSPIQAQSSSLESRIIGLLSGGSFRPKALVGRHTTHTCATNEPLGTVNGDK